MPGVLTRKPTRCELTGSAELWMEELVSRRQRGVRLRLDTRGARSGTCSGTALRASCTLTSNKQAATIGISRRYGFMVDVLFGPAGSRPSTRNTSQDRKFRHSLCQTMRSAANDHDHTDPKRRCWYGTRSTPPQPDHHEAAKQDYRDPPASTHPTRHNRGANRTPPRGCRPPTPRPGTRNPSVVALLALARPPASSRDTTPG